MYEEPEDDFLIQAQRKAKKSFLVEEIIDQNYSPILFTKFCERLRGTDVDEYSFEELQEVVRRFKQKYAPGQADEELEEQPQPVQTAKTEEPTEVEVETQPEGAEQEPAPTADAPEASTPSKADLSSSEPEESKTPSEPQDQSGDSGSENESPGDLPPPSSRQDTDNIYFTGLNVEPVFSEAYPVNANYLPENELSQELNAKVTVVKYTVESGGLLSASHVFYELHTAPMNWRVTRKEADFIWLKGVLQCAYPGYYVSSRQLPPNPPKKTMNKFENETLRKRVKFLQEFINAILRCEIYKRSPILLGFLKEGVPKQFELLKKVILTQQGSKMRRPLKVDDMQSISGSLMCNPTTSQDFAIRLNTFLTNSELVKKKLKRQTELLMQAFKGLSVQIKTFNDSVKELSNLQESIPEAHRHKLIYGELVNVLETWSRQEDDMAEQINEAFNMFFKYRYNEMSAVRDMIKEREGFLSIYLKAEKGLKAKKEQLWQKGDVLKWDIRPEDSHIEIGKLKKDKELAFSKMLHVESAIVQKQKDTYGFYNYQLQAELERVMSEASEVESRHFNGFGEMHTKSMQRIETQWRAMYSKTKHLYIKTQEAADLEGFRQLAEAGERI